MKNTIYNVNSDNSCTMNISSQSMKRTELRSLSLSKGRSKRHSKGRKLLTLNSSLLTVLFCLMVGGKAWGQSTTLTLYDGETTNSHYYSPYGGFYGWHYQVYLYDASDVDFDGTITAVSFKTSSSYSANSTANYTIYMKDVSSGTTLNASTAFSTYLNGSTTCYSSGTMPALESGWNTTPTFSNSFSHESGNSILVIVKAKGCTSSGGCSKYVYYKSISNHVWYYRADVSDLSDPPAESSTGSLAAYLPAIKFTYTPIASSCPKPTNLTASNISATGATLSWTERGSATNWVLEYGTASDFTGATSVNVSGTPSKVLSGLTSETTYYARVKSNCDGGDESEWITCEFTPSNCHALGTGTDMSINGTYGGIYTYMNNYAYTQQLYTASELGATAGVVESISLHYGETSTNSLTFEIYLGQTSQTSVPTSWITDANLTKVYGPTSTTFTSANNGWKSIDISSANWEWDGTSNILVAIRRTDKTRPSGTSFPDFYHTNSTSPYMMAYVSHSSSSIGLGSNNVATTNGSLNEQRPEIKFCITPACDKLSAPTFSVTPGLNKNTLSWSNVANNQGYKVQYATNSSFTDGVGTADIAQNATSWVHNGSGGSTYYYRMLTKGDGSTYCAEGDYSGEQHAQMLSCTSLSAPTNVSASAIYQGASLTWNAVANASSYTVYWGTTDACTGGSQSGITGTSYEVTGLTPGTPYYFKVMAVGSGTYCTENTKSSYVSATPVSRTLTVSTETINCVGAGSTTLRATVSPAASGLYYTWSASPSEGAGLPQNHTDLTTNTITVNPTAAGNYTYTCVVSESAGGGASYSIGQVLYTDSNGDLALSGTACYVMSVSGNKFTVLNSQVSGTCVLSGHLVNTTSMSGVDATAALYNESETSTCIYTVVSRGWYVPSASEIQAFISNDAGKTAYLLSSPLNSTGTPYRTSTINSDGKVTVIQRTDPTTVVANSTDFMYNGGGPGALMAKEFSIGVSASATITVGQSPTINDFPASPVSACGSYDITPSISNTACSDVSWAWSGDGSGSGSGISVTQYTASTSGTYTFTATTSSLKQYDMITQNGISAIVVVVPTMTTDGKAVPILDNTISPNTGDGTVSYNAYEYLQEAIKVNGGNTYSSGSRNAFKIPAGAAGGVCQSTASVEVEINTPAVGTVTASADPATICNGSSSELTASATGNSGTMSYAWSNGESGATVSVSPTVTTTYTVTATATVGGCIATTTKQVSVMVNTPDITGNYDYIWKSGTSTDWNTASNWYEYDGENYTVASTLPSEPKNYFIGTGDCLPTDQWPSLSAEATVNNITISGGNVSIPENNTLNIKGNIGVTNNGTFTANNNSTVVFCGTSAQTVDGELAFGKLTFNNARGVTLNNDVTVNSLATFTSGIVNGNMTFETSASSADASYTSYVNGTVTKKGNGSSFIFPTGNDNVLGSIQASVETGKTVSVQFRHNSAGFSESEMPRWWNSNDNCEDNETRFDHVSNFEYWKVNTTSALSATITVSAETETEHFNSEATTYNIEDIFAAMWQGCWNNVGGGTGSVSVTHDTIIVSGIEIPAVSTRASEPQWLTLGSKSHSTLLPIELTSFTAQCDGRSALVEWTTATEKNNDYFSLERSDDAINFVEVARVAGAGNSIEPIDYAYTDYGIHGGDNYYRLVQVDYDGTRTVSEIVVANCIEPEVGEPDVQVYPNPFNDELTVVLDNFGNRAATIEVYDMLGKLIYTNKVAAPQNSYETILNLSNLPPAAYTVRVSTNDFVINRNVVKQ